MWVYKGVEIENQNNYAIIIRIDEDGEFYDRYCSGFDMEFLNSQKLSITPIPNPPKLLPVGTKVRVFEEYDSYHSKDEFIIESIYIGNYNVKWDAFRMIVPARAVYPVLE